jgi:hypothetical protein
VASPSRNPAANPGHPACDWEAAFTFWAALTPEERSYQAVATEFGVSVRTVETHGRRERWAGRLRAIQAQAAAQTDALLASAWAERLAEVEKLLEASLVTYAQQLRGGGVRITASEFVGLVRLILQLRGEPTGRIELVADSQEWIGLRTTILDALAAYPDAQAALAAALETG